MKRHDYHFVFELESGRSHFLDKYDGDRTTLCGRTTASGFDSDTRGGVYREFNPNMPVDCRECYDALHGRVMGEFARAEGGVR